MILPALTSYEHALATVTDAGTSRLLNAMSSSLVQDDCRGCGQPLPVGVEMYHGDACADRDNGPVESDDEPYDVEDC